jgi:geranylgeranyl pyrophosphate synthase
MPVTPRADPVDLVRRRVDALVLEAVESVWSTRRVALGRHAAMGKRLRTTLAAQVAHATQPTDSLVAGAAAIEVLHLATLVHDDCIDESATRRGLRSIWDEHGAARAIVAGDALFAVSFRLACGAPSAFNEVLAAATEAVCDGQMGELDDIDDRARTVDRVEVISAAKTGGLFAAAAQLGAMEADLDPSAYRDAGVGLGVVYQLLDDLQDVDVRGGATAGDLRAGLLTQPWIASGLNIDELSPAPGAGPQADRALDALWRTSGPAWAAHRIARIAETLVTTAPADALTDMASSFTAEALEIVRRNDSAGLVPRS